MAKDNRTPEQKEADDWKSKGAGLLAGSGMRRSREVLRRVCTDSERFCRILEGQMGRAGTL